MKQQMKESIRKKRERGYGPKIKVQLLIGFTIPILFVILVGKFSYNKAESSLIQNYEEAILSAIEMGSDYLDFGFGLTASDTLQLTLDSGLADYAYGKYDNDQAAAISAYNKIQSSIIVKQASNHFMESIWIIPKSNGKIMSTDGNAQSGFYEEWAKSEEGKSAFSGGSNFKWVSTHPFLDENMKKTEEEYALSYMGTLTNKAALVVINVSPEAVMERLQSLDLGEGSVAAFLTEDGSQIAYYNENTGGTEAEKNDKYSIAFSEQSFYNACIEKEDKEGSEYVTYNNEEYLFMYRKSDVNASVLCALVPRSLVVQGAEDIKEFTNWLVLIACIVVGIFAISISVNISSGISRIVKKLKRASGGDLTVHLSTKGHSELTRLSRNVANVIHNTRALIMKAGETMRAVQESTFKVADVSRKILEGSENISGAVKDINSGISKQSHDVQDCAIMMTQLSAKMEVITDTVLTVEKLADATEQMIQQGMGSMQHLSIQSQTTTSMTDAVQNNIQELEIESAKIRNFVDVINGISKQTNLLSLNASIEAARAGSAGRGFSVVADEIRKLAEGSLNAAYEIEKVVSTIGDRTAETVKAAGNAKEMVDKQTATVVQTQEVFGKMSYNIKELLEKLCSISESVQHADEGREAAMTAIDGIAAVSVETAASSSIVTQSVVEQLAIMETLKTAARELDSNMKELTEALTAFTV